jgi:hypothetical protein
MIRGLIGRESMAKGRRAEQIGLSILDTVIGFTTNAIQLINESSRIPDQLREGEARVFPCLQ